VALSVPQHEQVATMEAAVDAALKEFGVNLVAKLQSALEKEQAARIAFLDERERKLEARSIQLDHREQSLERREASLRQTTAGPGLFGSRTQPASLEKPPVQASAPQLGLSARSSLHKPGPALQHRNQTNASTSPAPAGAGGGIGLGEPQQPDAAAGPNSPRGKTSSVASASALFRPFTVSNTPTLAATGQRAGEGASVSAPRRSLGRSYSCGPSSSPNQTKPGGGAASELRDLYERKAAVARQEASPARRQSWQQVQNELPLPDGSRTERFRAHEAPYKRTSSGLTPVGAPPEKRSLEELLRADEQRTQLYT